MTIHSIPPLVALTAEPDAGLSLVELTDVAGALQKQVTRDFAPHWHVPATLSAARTPKDIKPGYWPIVVRAQLDVPGALGYHADQHRQPVAYVQAGNGWATTASHELLEMLADPYGSRLVICTVQQKRVRALVEVCDPCEAQTYMVDGIAVSDFVLPGYYGPHRWRFAANAADLSFTGSIDTPLTVSEGGYLSWIDGGHHWWQETWFSGSHPSVRELSREKVADLIEIGGVSPREAVDAETREWRASLKRAGPATGG